MVVPCLFADAEIVAVGAEKGIELLRGVAAAHGIRPGAAYRAPNGIVFAVRPAMFVASCVVAGRVLELEVRVSCSEWTGGEVLFVPFLGLDEEEAEDVATEFEGESVEAVCQGRMFRR